MITRAQIITFFALLALINALLLIPWPWWTDAYARGFRNAANVLFDSIGSQGRVQFEPGENPAAIEESQVVLRNLGSGAKARMAFSCRLTGWLPTALTAALIMATPLPWRRRIAALVAGLVLVHVFIAVRVWILLIKVFSAPDTLAVYSPAPLVRGLVSALADVISISLIGAFLGPLVIWMLVAFLRSAWDAEPPCNQLGH
jgi:hypothetical protein